ncbi:MAG TPA: ParB N-terminal domain-containing protein [Candidatus Bathyarchaeia archaeon]|nr:ParB N-terminal domain-containing protein [Candidatus Bathyarchaeia archaeon]
MEANSSLKGYPIAGGRIPVVIALKKISDLKPHEETVPEDLNRLVNSLKENPILRHPIIADKNTGIVLDGTHRLAAVSHLNCNFIPTALVDYDDPKIQVERWFRQFSGENNTALQRDLKRLNPQQIDHNECEKGLSTRRLYATIENKRCLAFLSRSSDPCDMARDSHEIETIARNLGVKVTYQDNKELEFATPERLVMSTIRIEKNEVVENVKKRKLFPPKSTRHLVPSRPLGAGVPIEWLQGTNFPEAQSRYHDYLLSRKIRRLPEGSRVGSRRYLEEVFLFE